MPVSCEKEKSAEAIDFEYYTPEELPDCLLMDLDHTRVTMDYSNGTKEVIFKGDQFSEIDLRRRKATVFRIQLPTPSPTATEPPPAKPDTRK